jgi:predicted MFS family arabinose efflux permease
MTPESSSPAVAIPAPRTAPVARVRPDMRLLGLLVWSFTASVALGQAYMPSNPGMASGLIVGFAIGAGGLGVTALGLVADHWSLMASLWISALIPLAGFALALFLPEPCAR